MPMDGMDDMDDMGNTQCAQHLEVLWGFSKALNKTS